MKKLWLIFVIVFLLLLEACTKVPQSVKDTANNYKEKQQKQELANNMSGDSSDAASGENRENLVGTGTIETLLEHKEELLKRNWDNLKLPTKISAIKPEEVSSLSLKVTDDFGSDMTILKKLCNAFFQNQDYKIERTDAPYDVTGVDCGGYVWNYGKEGNSFSAFDNGFSCFKLGTMAIENRKALYHADQGDSLTDTYSLKGEQVSVQDAVDYVNEWCNEYWSLLEPDYCFQVKTVYVCSQNETDDYFAFDVAKYYKGIPFEDIIYLDDNNEDVLRVCYKLDVYMTENRRLSFVRNNECSFQVVQEEEYTKDLVTLEEAIKLVEKTMTGAQKLQIADIQTKYTILSDVQNTVPVELHYDTPNATATVRPVWSFIIEVPEATKKGGSWIRKFINVDMLTGDVKYQNTYLEY